MRLSTLAPFLTLPVLLIAGTPREPNSIARLDDCIQRRFLDGKSFGMSRILPMAHITRLFAAENPAEQAVVSQFVKEGYEAALFLAGQNSIRGLVQGPVFITPIQKPGELPDAADLLTDSRSAFSALEKSSGYSIPKGEWTVAMRPLRASHERCVQCHSQGMASFGSTTPAPKLGDALGVAMYVYRRTR